MSDWSADMRNSDKSSSHSASEGASLEWTKIKNPPIHLPDAVRVRTSFRTVLPAGPHSARFQARMHVRLPRSPCKAPGRDGCKTSNHGRLPSAGLSEQRTTADLRIFRIGRLDHVAQKSGS